MRHSVLDTESPASIEGFKLFCPLYPSNYATLNQLCIQAHSSSLRCGGSLCKVQSDEKRVAARNDNKKTAPHLSSLRVGGQQMLLPLIGEGRDGEFPAMVILQLPPLIFPPIEKTSSSYKFRTGNSGRTCGFIIPNKKY